MASFSMVITVLDRMIPLAGNGTNFVKLVALTATQTTTRLPFFQESGSPVGSALAEKTFADGVPPLVTDTCFAQHAAAAMLVPAPQPGNPVSTAALRAASRTPWRTEME